MCSRQGRFGYAAVAAMAVAVLTLSGCSSRIAAASSVPPQPEEPAATATASLSPSAIEDDGRPTSPQDAARGTAVATRAARAFCHPRRPPQVWLGALSPFLTIEAVSAYSSVQPNRVACTRTAGTAVPRVSDPFTQQVSVPTDAGDLLVTLQRPDGRSRWQVSRIAVPERHIG